MTLRHSSSTPDRSSKKKAAILFLVGPTASGKSGLAVELAKRLHGEIVSADSMLVYKGMDVGTAKPALKERTLVPHHGIDLIPPSRNFSVFEYREFALKAIREIVRRGRLPIVAGGTGFYIRALLEGLSPQPGSEPSVRRKLEREALEKGLPALYRRLLRVDRKRALQTGPHNQRRIIRALEIYLVSGKKPSRPVQKSPGLKALGYRPVVIGLNRDRAALYRAINERVDRMFRKGLVKEVRRLSRKRLSATAAQGVGYKEVLAFLTPQRPGLYKGAPRRGRVSARRGMEEVKEKIKQATRHFAKRQWTWFKKEKGIRWVWWPETAALADVSQLILKRFLCNTPVGKNQK